MAGGKPGSEAGNTVAEEDARNREKTRVAGEPAATEEPPATGKPAAGTAGDLVTIVPGIARYHRSSCLLIRFLTADDLETMTRQTARDSGCVACRACQPDSPSAND